MGPTTLTVPAVPLALGLNSGFERKVELLALAPAISNPAKPAIARFFLVI
jgi:hypothetical protein